MADNMELRGHPRLYLGEKEIGRLTDGSQAEDKLFLKSAREAVAKEADRFLTSPVVEFDLNLHNAHLLRARSMQGRIVTLLVRWKQTGEDKYRQAAIEHVREMGRWEFWGWESWRADDHRPDAEFDLSYGENSATLAMAYDWLHDTLTPQQKADMVNLGRKWVVASFLKHTVDPLNRPRWFANPHSNWNTVCAGGAGMLALAMSEDIAEAPQMLTLTEESVLPYMKTLENTAGGWPEGVGYWNYGMRYAFMYLLSWERATGRLHPLMELHGTRQTLRFPMDFCPNGVACSFGDVPAWGPMPIHFATANRLNEKTVLAGLEGYMAQRQYGPINHWPDAAEILLMYPREPLTASITTEQNVAKLYPQLDWGILADRLPNPTMYLAIRGGTTTVPHSHLDLLSFFAVVGHEAMITSLGNAEYMDTTFSSRRWEIFEMTPAAKNTILINGVGITLDSQVSTEVVAGKNWKGIRLDATETMGMSRGKQPVATFCGRLFIMLAGKGFIVLDRVELPHPGRVETRLHTWQEVDLAPTSALIKGPKEHLRAAWACDVPAVLASSVPAMTRPVEKNPLALRWCTRERTHQIVTLATLLTPGDGPASIEIVPETDEIVLKIAGQGWQEIVRVNTRLR